MAAAAPRQLGITPPLSTALPTDAEKQATDALIEEMTKENLFESRADTEKRYVTAIIISYRIRRSIIARNILLHSYLFHY